MSNINDRNFLGSYVSVVGNAVGPVEYKERNGFEYAVVTVAVNLGYKKDGTWVQTGVNYYDVEASADHARKEWPDIRKADKVRVDDGQLEARAYIKTNGDAGLGLTVKWASLEILESRAGQGGGSTESPWNNSGAAF